MIPLSVLYSIVTDNVALITVIIGFFTLILLWKNYSLSNKIYNSQIERDNREKRLNEMADLIAKYVKVDQKNKLRIINKGKSDANNIRFEIIEARSIDIIIEEIFPFERLEPEGELDLVMAIQMGNSTKLKIKLIWDDTSEKDRSKEIVIKIY